MVQQIKELYFQMGAEAKYVTLGKNGVTKIILSEKEARFDFAEGAEMVIDRRHVIGYSVGKPYTESLKIEPKKFNNKAMKRALKK